MRAIKIKTTWVTEDGTECQTEDEARKHELRIFVSTYEFKALVNDPELLAQYLLTNKAKMLAILSEEYRQENPKNPFGVK